MKDFFLR